MDDIKVAFWNLQNLFDTTASDIAADLEFTAENGWTADVQTAKLRNLAQIIRAMHDGAGPDLLGVCEIENLAVADALLGAIGRSDLVIAHDDSEDLRGIDCALFYSRNVFELIDPPPRGHMVHLRFRTRDIFEVTLRHKASGAELHVLVNHWPSRSAGAAQSEPYRIAVANHCGQLVDELLTFGRSEYLTMPDTEDTLRLLNQRWDRNVLLMGDFNDEPFNRSLLDELGGSAGLDKLEEPIARSPGRATPWPATYLAKSAYLFNCMWPALAEPDRGTYHYSEGTNTMITLDQFLVSRGLYYGLSGLRMKRVRESSGGGGESVEAKKVWATIFDHDAMVTSAAKRRPKAFEFSRNQDTGKVKHNNGYSDHFPIETLIEVIN